MPAPTPDFSPITNPNAICLIRQEDGNYIGYTQKNGKMIAARQGDPNTVITMLITHDGKTTKTNP